MITSSLRISLPLRETQSVKHNGYLVFKNLFAVKGDTTQMHLSTEMIKVIKLEMICDASIGASTVFRYRCRQYSSQSGFQRPRKL